MLLPILTLLGTQLVLPGYFVYSLWRGQETSQTRWLLKVLYSAAFMLYLFLIGRWDWLGYYVRYAWLALFALSVIVSYRRARGKPRTEPGGQRAWRSYAGDVFSLLVFSGFLAFAVRGYFYAETPVRLMFPLQAGRYYVGQGGNSSIINYHNPSRAQRYALDIVALNATGLRAAGLYPSDVRQYVVYGKPVISPCEGVVQAAVDGLPDQTPPQTDRENLAGNHVVLRCQGVDVALAHLQPGTVMVQTGDVVTVGQALGRVGNSGNTSEPHLHIHAVRVGSGDILRGEGVPLVFDEQFLVRNAVLAR